MDDLRLIQFETSTACNGHCMMCPRWDMTRPGGKMSQALFEKILADGMALGVRHFIPFLNGEPLLFPQFWQWMDIMRGLGLATTIFTNGSLLTTENAERLASYRNITGVVVSFHGGTKDAYERVMGLDYEANKAHAQYLMQIAPYPVQAYMTAFEGNADSAQAFKDEWQDRAFVGAYFNWAGARPSVIGERNSYHDPLPCHRILHEMTILWDGRVALCCMDYDGQVILGDANTESLRDIWERNQPMRDKHHAREFSGLLCEKCNVNRFGV